MKRTFQKVECIVPKNSTKQFSGELRQDYGLCAGVLFVNSNFDSVTMRMTIAGREVFPTGTNVCLFDFNGNYSRDEAKYDLSAETIPAKSSEYQIDFDNPTSNDVTITCYFELKNE